MGCMSVPYRFIYVVYESYIVLISILRRFYTDVISMYIAPTSSVFKLYIDSYWLYSMPCWFIYVVCKSYIAFIPILYRFYIDVISVYLDFTSGVYKSYIESYRLYISAMPIHIRRLQVVYRHPIDPVSILYWCHLDVDGFHIERI